MKIRDRLVSSWCLALLTFLLVVGIVPAAQSQISVASITQTVIAKNTPEALLNEGRFLYEAEKFTDAATVWQQAATAYAQQQDLANQAWSLSYLSLAQQALGQWSQAETAIALCLKLLQQSDPEAAIQAQVLNIQGHLQSSTGKTEAAIETWQQAEAAYQTIKAQKGILGSKINQSQALRRLGLYRRAETILNSVEQELQTQSNSPFKVQSLQSLGIALQTVGKLSESQAVLQQSLALAERLNKLPGILT
jgi:tetratricopeptide (TPR) repeat protein